jgi:hypothetical protein
MQGGKMLIAAAIVLVAVLYFVDKHNKWAALFRVLEKVFFWTVCLAIGWPLGAWGTRWLVRNLDVGTVGLVVVIACACFIGWVANKKPTVQVESDVERDHYEALQKLGLK